MQVMYNDVQSDELPVFICYRQADGMGTAQWLHDTLHGQTISSGENNVKLNVYQDTRAAAVGDWTTIHLPSLQRANAFIFVLTPGQSHLISR